MSTEQSYYIAVLTPDEDGDGELSYLDSVDQLNAFLELHGGKYKGWYCTNKDEIEGHAVVSMTSETAEKLQAKDFVEQNPLETRKNIHLLEFVPDPTDPSLKPFKANVYTYN